MQRLACTLIGLSLLMIVALVALLFSDAMAPARLPPLFGFYAASAAGLLLILGLALLEPRGSRMLTH